MGCLFGLPIWAAYLNCLFGLSVGASGDLAIAQMAQRLIASLIPITSLKMYQGAQMTGWLKRILID